MTKMARLPGNLVKYFFLFLMLILTVYPLYWMIYAGSFNSAELIRFVIGWKPGTHAAENYAAIRLAFDIFRVFGNTVFVAANGTVLALFVNLMMGYALAKYEFRHKQTVFALFVVTMFVGGAAMMIPQFEIIMKLGLYNNLFAIILPSIYSTYTSFLVRQTLLDFPSEIIQSGRIDGCGEFGIFWRLVVPNIRAIVATVAIITFMGYWDGYLWNLIVTSTVENYTIQVALAGIYPKAGLWTQAPIRMLGAAMSVIPILILFLSMQKHFINSITGAVKG